MSGVFLLAAVAVTPSLGGLHNLCAAVLLLMLYGYLGGLLWGAGRGWLCFHLAVPVALLLATKCHSYGLWQKALIVYFVLALNVRYHVLVGPRPPKRTGRGGGVVVGGKRRVVYAVQMGEGWRRRG